MDELRQTTKLLRKSVQETNQNIRRYSENTPQVERTVDSVSPVFSYKKEFRTTGHPHTVNLNLKFGEQEKPCNLNQIDEYIACETLCGGSTTATGEEQAMQYDGFASNIGGFTFAADNRGIVVPLSGIYNIRVMTEFGSVADVGQENIAWISVSIRRNGYILQQVKKISPCGLCAFFPHFDLFAQGVYCNAGDVVGGWEGAIAGLPFYTPANLCGLFHGQPTIVELVAQP